MGSPGTRLADFFKTFFHLVFSNSNVQIIFFQNYSVSKLPPLKTGVRGSNRYCKQRLDHFADGRWDAAATAIGSVGYKTAVAPTNAAPLPLSYGEVEFVSSSALQFKYFFTLLFVSLEIV
jgi:hypothetical protein